MANANILVVDDESDIRSLIMEILTDEGYSVEVAADGGEARDSYASSTPDMVLLDIWMPDVDGITLLKEWSEGDGHHCPVVIMSGHGTVDTAIEATRLGAVDYIEKPLSLSKLLRSVDAALTSSGGATSEPVVGRRYALLEPIGKSEAMQTLREQCQVLAGHKAPLLISGEAGTGRESCARYINSLAAGPDKKALQVLAGSVLTAEAGIKVLSDAIGAVDNGCLIITELQDMHPDAQRFLQGIVRQGYVARTHGDSPLPLSCRVIATIDNEALAAGTVDAQLLEAVGALKLRLPPLRDYREDVPELLRHYVDELGETEGLPFRHFSVAAQNRLRNYPWPGNVRELRRLVRELLIAGGDEEIALTEIEAALDASAPVGGTLVKSDMLALSLREAREMFEREYLLRQLQLCGGKVGKLAERVGMERTHLYRKLRSLDIDFRQVGSED